MALYDKTGNKLTLSQLRAGVIGHAIGDALGVPVEFATRSQLTLDPVTNMRSGGTYNMPAGTWSDDTSMELCLMQSVIDEGAYNYDDIMKNFVLWCQKDRFVAGEYCFDIGNTCANSISRYMSGISPLKCGSNTERGNGNGSLMRILPVAFVCSAKNINGLERYRAVKDISSLTHAHEISVLGCYAYINFICALLDGENKHTAYDRMQQADYSMFSDKAQQLYRRILKENIHAYTVDSISSSGYVLHTLEASLWAIMRYDSYAETVLAAVNLGSDTDTVGAITGSMAGVLYGFDAIPDEWIQTLQRHDYLLTMCDNFFAAITA